MSFNFNTDINPKNLNLAINYLFNTKNKFKLYENLNSSFMATRYHSLYLDSINFPNNLLISARSNDDNIIMSFKHKDFPIFGLQYHPESIETKVGNTILDNFLNIL